MEAFDALDEYVEELENLVALASADPEQFKATRAAPPHLDGYAAQRVRESVDLFVRRNVGAFFAGSELRLRAARMLPPNVRMPIHDPSCGAGDLLLGALDHLVGRDRLGPTGLECDPIITGRELIPQLSRLARGRLQLFLAHNGALAQGAIAQDLIDIRWGDGLATDAGVEAAGCLMVNPPFGLVQAPGSVEWTSGTTTAAAIHADTLIQRLNEGAFIIAILPDVLRTGSRYNRWRNHLETLMDVARVEPVGRFDRWTNVDVFLLAGVRRTTRDVSSSTSWWEGASAKQRIDDHFRCAIGAVVPHRHAESGPLVPYLTPGTVPPWVEYQADAYRRRFSGRLHAPPLVLLRRTSHPKTVPRVQASVITGHEEVAVENHFVVLAPRDSRLSTCHKAMGLLADDSVTDWLNNRIRCRHLTIDAVRNIPWSPKG